MATNITAAASTNLPPAGASAPATVAAPTIPVDDSPSTMLRVVPEARSDYFQSPTQRGTNVPKGSFEMKSRPAIVMHEQAASAVQRATSEKGVSQNVINQLKMEAEIAKSNAELAFNTELGELFLWSKMAQAFQEHAKGVRWLG